jgi:molybdopterin converting factor small subunit
VVVRICTPLRSYTKASHVRATGATIAALIADLDRQFPGLQFRVLDEQGRIRQHMRIYIDRDHVRRTDLPVRPDQELTLMQALSGG